ncbi:MAG: DJ-1/PfpI family protein [Candidatus Thiodiazotropha endolucinida]|nr:DJ-1/PfpI family protein [Candidatus Thiodiazotropha taylori]MCW4328775.1 DJ-1/PfpI family protein [Candidatus Thiodiazotropha endolucinida]MCG8062437.1 DJ-1/PfpI family protein [Candidatus Thiodiazotropha taylori]MCG8062698.1 DJ-1/PfpI family protein [Candidatus Thiodiazotropha taylori]MCW4346035.1 DJ-1/PfpI family protein [Candidatus Thiodiazotropha endolucinida]
MTDLLTRADIEVVTAGLKDGPVKASRGITLVPDTTLDAVMDQAFDMMVLPGGLPGADYLDADPRIHEMLKRLNQQGKFTAAICAAPKVLAGAGLLQGRRATSYPGVLDNMDLPQVDVQLERVISDDRVITSRGPGTAMDFALELIEQLSGRETRDQVEQLSGRETRDQVEQGLVR